MAVEDVLARQGELGVLDRHPHPHDMVNAAQIPLMQFLGGDDKDEQRRIRERLEAALMAARDHGTRASRNQLEQMIHFVDAIDDHSLMNKYNYLEAHVDRDPQQFEDFKERGICNM